MIIDLYHDIIAVKFSYHLCVFNNIMHSSFIKLVFYCVILPVRIFRFMLAIDSTIFKSI